MKIAYKQFKQMLFGGLTFVPGLRQRLLQRNRGTGGTDSARYCYTVWLRHLINANAHGACDAGWVVSELGPGDSIGIGLAALLSGAKRYSAFDVVEYTSLERNIQIFDELVTLFRSRADLPNDDEYPRVFPKLESYPFPADILTSERLDAALQEDRLNRIKSSLLNTRAPDSMIHYVAPWSDTELIEPSSVDFIYSQAVLEHIDDLVGAYKACNRWLKPGGLMSHCIDFKCHGLAEQWNGHWTYSDLRWRIIRGKRPWLINRQPYSAHLQLFEENGFEVVNEQPVRSTSAIKRSQLSSRFRDLTRDDLTTSTAFIQARKGTIA